MTVQFRLTIRFIGVILVAGVALSGITAYHVGKVLFDDVQDRVSLDLNSARTVYDAYADNIGLFLRGTSLDPTLAGFLADPRGAEDQLRLMLQTGGIDRLCLLDVSGTVVAAAPYPRLAGRSLAADPAVSNAIRRQSIVTGTVLLHPVEPDRRAPTRPSGNPPPPEELLSGPDGVLMAVAAAVPILDPNGRMIGILYGAHALNDRIDVVDTIRAEVFRYRAWKGIHIGTATIFQSDLRIATNVRSGDGRRAVGTRMTEDVYQEVIVKGNRFADSAYVVNDWYFTAFEPIRDPDGNTIGALYVGLLRAPFVETRNTTIAIFLVTITGVAALILILLIAATRQVLHPIDRIVAMTARVAGGDLTARVGLRPSGEMGRLCTAVDRMADAVAEREEQLELATRRQLTQSEKLASIGRLAAGVAHEVNNPLTGVLTFTHLLRGKPNLDDQDRADLDVVIGETTRVRDIVRGLLDFARESPTRQQWLDVNEVVRQATWLVRNQKEFGDIAMREDLGEGLPLVYGDRNQLQQVFLNLSLNACEAMPNGGTLTITTTTRDDEAIVRVVDTGQGIPCEDLEQIFEPFYTTKPVGKGTGLGLSVSYGIIRRHGGTIEVKSELGKGTVFVVRLPLKPPAEAGPASPPPAGQEPGLA